MDIEVDLDLRPVPHAARKARDSLEKFAPHVPSGKLDDARLAMSEVVTNALCHANLSPENGRISVQVRLRADVLHARVCDTGDGFEPPAGASPGDFLGGGWGLYLVAAVCESWGVEKGEMFCVWFEI